LGIVVKNGAFLLQKIALNFRHQTEGEIGSAEEQPISNKFDV
jgi:hypothetical protein